jgi:hypothetical protein
MINAIIQMTIENSIEVAIVDDWVARGTPTGLPGTGDKLFKDFDFGIDLDLRGILFLFYLLRNIFIIYK